jgi:hypothetical protein
MSARIWRGESVESDSASRRIKKSVARSRSRTLALYYSLQTVQSLATMPLHPTRILCFTFSCNYGAKDRDRTLY